MRPPLTRLFNLTSPPRHASQSPLPQTINLANHSPAHELCPPFLLRRARLHPLRRRRPPLPLHHQEDDNRRPPQTPPPPLSHHPASTSPNPHNPPHNLTLCDESPRKRNLLPPVLPGPLLRARGALRSAHKHQTPDDPRVLLLDQERRQRARDGRDLRAGVGGARVRDGERGGRGRGERAGGEGCLAEQEDVLREF